MGPETTEDDRKRFLGDSAAHKVIAIETGWLDRLRQTELYMYHMPPATFVIRDRDAGYYVSTEAIAPLKVEPAGDLLNRLAGSGAEVRITPSLQPLADAVAASTLRFSMIRLRNAAAARGNSPPED